MALLRGGSLSLTRIVSSRTMSDSSFGPVEAGIREKLGKEFQPTHLEVSQDWQSCLKIVNW